MIYYTRNKMLEKCRWHKWFAWYPVTVSITPDKDRIRVWGQYVCRCGKVRWGEAGTYLEYQYKLEMDKGE